MVERSMRKFVFKLLVLSSILITSVMSTSDSVKADGCGCGALVTANGAAQKNGSALGCCPPGSPHPYTDTDISNLRAIYVTPYGTPSCICFNNRICNYSWISYVGTDECCGTSQTGATTTTTWTQTQGCPGPNTIGKINVQLPNGTFAGTKTFEFEMATICIDAEGNHHRCDYMAYGEVMKEYVCDNC
jgi:hypothetical protein